MSPEQELAQLRSKGLELLDAAKAAHAKGDHKAADAARAEAQEIVAQAEGLKSVLSIHQGLQKDTVAGQSVYDEWKKAGWFPGKADKVETPATAWTGVPFADGAKLAPIAALGDADRSRAGGVVPIGLDSRYVYPSLPTEGTTTRRRPCSSSSRRPEPFRPPRRRRSPTGRTPRSLRSCLRRR